MTLISGPVSARQQIPALTSFRFFAASFVVLFHYDKKQYLFPAGLAEFGYEAVTFFFVLSGFILTYSHATRDGLNVSAAQFLRLRLIRILPLYWIGLFVALPFVVFKVIKSGFDWKLLLVVPMLQSWVPSASLLWNSPAWSLSNEAFFYLVYPAIWSVWRQMEAERGLLISVALVACCSVLRLFLPADWHHFSAYFPLLNLPQFVLGISLAKRFMEVGPAKSPGTLLFVTSTALAAIIAIKPYYPLVADGTILCAVMAPMIYSLSALKAFSWRPLTALGEASYAIYILHVPLWMWWDRVCRIDLALDLSPAIDFTLYATAVVATSFALRFVAERPFRALLREWLMPAAKPAVARV